MDKRRQEIEAKRAKLAELRKARADRQRETERRTSDQSAGPSTTSKREVDEILNTLLNTGPRNGLDSGDLTPSSSVPGTPAFGHTVNLPAHSALSSASGRASRQSDVAERLSVGQSTMVGSSNSATDHVIERTMTPRSFPNLINIEQELFELPHKERVIYNKEVQTTFVETEPSADYEAELRQRITREREVEESVKLDQEIEEVIRELTEEERASIIAAPEFLEFVENSSKIVQRALNDGYDYIRDYTLNADSGGDESEGKRVKRVCEFWDERYGKNRSITDIDWSPKCGSYNKNPAALNEPDGIVAVWNLHLLERPEFVFHHKCVYLSYTLSAAGHTHPVYAMQMVGTQNAHNLITSSTDGMVCSWLVDMLAQPQVYAEVAITTLDFPDNETTRHAGPVMGLHFHPLVGPVDFSDLFLTSSVDWTVKLWRAKSLSKPSTAPQVVAPLYSFDEADDYVYDVKWHPAHPATFGTVDGSGRFDLWNLNADTEVRTRGVTVVGPGRALNKLQWDKKDGRRAALGGSDGRLYIYDIGDMALPRESEWTDMQKTVASVVGSGQPNGVVESDPARIVAGR
ncbi:cytoplasmic dynein intermediate chain [Pholiota molesta]|nr:cytoplasmic dynein intermediate chain [Pholiota molesta]